MEYSIRFGAEGVTAEVSGTSELAGQMNLYRDLVGDPRFSPGMSILIDYRGLDERRAPNADVERLSRFVSSLDAELGDAKLAVVVPDTVSYGIGRMSQAQIDTRLRIRFFFERDEAAAWLCEGSTVARAAPRPELTSRA
jgi:hypothetical protein